MPPLLRKPPPMLRKPKKKRPQTQTMLHLLTLLLLVKPTVQKLIVMLKSLLRTHQLLRKHLPPPTVSN